MSLPDRITFLVDERSGGNQAAFARLCGIDEASVRQWTTGSSKPSLPKLIAIASACSISLDWLVFGDKSKNIPISDQPEPDYIRVRALSFRASAGNGELVLDDDGKAEAISPALLTKLHLKPENARLLHAKGDSMRPTIEDGDPLLVDTSEREVLEGKIYVFTVGDDVFVKRLRRFGSRVMMRSDNRDIYPDEIELPADEPVRIIGRVKWVGRSL